MSPRLRASSRERTSRPRSPVCAIVVPGSILRGGTETTFFPTRQLRMMPPPSFVTSTSSSVTRFEPSTMTMLPRSGSEGQEGAGCAARWCARGSRARAYQGVRKPYAPSDPERNGFGKRWSAATTEHARRSHRERRPRGRAAPRPLGGWSGAWARDRRGAGTRDSPSPLPDPLATRSQRDRSERALSGRHRSRSVRGNDGEVTDLARKSLQIGSAPRVIRTPDLLIRSQTLYPTELWARAAESRT